MKRPRQYGAKVTVTEVAPDADQIVGQLLKAPAQLRGLIQRHLEARPLIEKGKRRAEQLAGENLKRSQAAQADRQKYREIALRLCEFKPELKQASREELAREVQTVLRRAGISKTTKTILRALPPKK